MDDSRIESHLGCLPIFPLPGVVLFPHTVLPLHIFEPRYRAMIRDARAEGLPIAMAQIDPCVIPSQQGELPQVHAVAGVGVLQNIGELPDGRFLVELQGRARVEILEELPLERPYRQVRARLLCEPEPSALALEQVQALRSMLLHLRRAPDVSSRVLGLVFDSDSPGVAADVAAHLFCDDSEQRQLLLEELTVEKRLALLIDHLSELLFPRRARGAVLN